MIGTEQQVSAVLRGSVQRLEGRVRVDAELLDAEDGERLWAGGYERPPAELPEIQRDIVRATLATLSIRPSEGERDVLDRPATSDAHAWELYLQGRAIELAGQSRELWHPVPNDNIRRAQALYTRARDLDPRFALARARLALMHTLAAAAYDTTQARRDQARVEAETALRLQPGLPEAHQALASHWQLNGDLAKAIEELGLALEGFPHSADLHITLGGVFMDAGRFEEAAGEYEHAAAILHPTLGTPFRAAVGGGKAIIPSAKKLGGPGTSIDVPLHFKDAAFVRTHFDAMEVRLPDAPKGNEILVALAVTDGGRPHPRVGGLTVAEAKKEDGLR